MAKRIIHHHLLQDKRNKINIFRVLCVAATLMCAAKQKNYRGKQASRGANRHQPTCCVLIKNTLAPSIGYTAFVVVSSSLCLIYGIEIPSPNPLCRLVMLVEPVRLLEEQVHRQTMAVRWRERLRGRPRRERADLRLVPFQMSWGM